MSEIEDPSDTAKGKGELVRDDPGKASELIQKFSASSNSQSFEKKERKIGKKFSNDRLHLWTKKSDESMSSAGATPSATATRGVKPGGGDGKWLKKLEEEEAARRDAAATNNTNDDAVSKLKAELQKAGLECTERSRLLSELREKYSILSRQLNDFQEILGIANSARIQLQNNINRSQREKETEQERKNRENEEREALKRQAIEMRGRLDELMESDRLRASLMEEMEKLKKEFEGKEALAISELNKLTSCVKELTDKLDARNNDWEKAEFGLSQAEEELLERRSAIEIRELELKSIQLELTELKTMYGSLQVLHTETMDEFESVRINLSAIESERDIACKQVDDLKRNEQNILSQLNEITEKNMQMTEKSLQFDEKLKAIEEREDEFNRQLDLKEVELKESEVEKGLLRDQISTIAKELGNIQNDLNEKDEELKYIVNDKENVYNEMNNKCKLLEEAEKELKELKVQIDDMNSAKGHFEDSLSLKEEAILSLKDEMNLIMNDKQALSIEFKKLEDVVTEKELEMQANSQETAEVIQEFERKESEWIVEKGSLQADILMKDHEIEWINKEKDTANTCYTDGVTSLQIDIDDLKREKRDLLSEIEKLTADSVEESKKMLERLEGLQKEIDIDRETNRNAVKEFEVVINGLENKIKDLEDNKVADQGTMAELIEERIETGKAMDVERVAFKEQMQGFMVEYEEKLLCSRAETDELRVSEAKLKEELKVASAEIELIVKEQSQIEVEFSKRLASTEIEKSKLELDIIEKDKEIAGIGERLDEAWALVKNNSDKHRSEIEKLQQMNLIACETAAVEALMTAKRKRKIALTPQSHRLAEFNILSIAPSYPKEMEQSGVEGPKIPPEVILIDDDRGSDYDESTPCQRGPSLQSYVDTLNTYREKMANREDKFLNRLTKVRDLESGLRLREKHVNDRIEVITPKMTELKWYFNKWLHLEIKGEGDTVVPGSQNDER